MSQKLLSQYANLTAQKEQIEQELARIANNPEFNREKEFMDKLNALMAEFDKDAPAVLELLNPTKKASSAPSSEQTGTRRKRKLKIYENPHTGERVETRGGNQKTLKTWKEEHGEETVESWLVDTQQ
ncbi:hypothetical protein DFO67_12418 [Modicisalibacter xianhensis]|uniref:MvaT DNA-binding domain-containing protein n=1 Tax=Modicisalibacter xianhensis TaxID=442341 RepID=A0A4R8FN79_9GAMM|nr:histone-like nucleoid-structuring protein, MvaT/MvaU family [Halomonas xianhensis]TDX23701.1 hypothetical protein DFO67_12418 [Halomonas xianhensis]